MLELLRNGDIEAIDVAILILGSVLGSKKSDPVQANFELPVIMNKRKFKEPRLVIPDKESVDQRWIIKYYVFDVQKNKVVMVRDREINKIKNLNERHRLAKLRMAKISAKLNNGYVIDRVKKKQREAENEAIRIKESRKSQKQSIKLVDAVSKIVNSKASKSESTFRDYKQVSKIFFQWLDKTDRTSQYLYEFDFEACKEYMNYQLQTRKVSNRYYNNVKGYLGTIFKELEEEGYPIENHFARIKKLRHGLGKNLAYNDDQQREVLALAESRIPQMIPIIKLLYYTLMREVEIMRLQVYDVHLDSRKIHLPAEKSKNRNSRIIELPEPAYQELNKLIGSGEYPDEYYVFSDNTLIPGPKMYNVKQLSARYSVNIMKKLNYGPNYTLYSWKHTGVVAAKLKGIQDAHIMMQGGWTDPTAYQKYLKSLALLDNTAFRVGIPEIGTGGIQSRR